MAQEKSKHYHSKNQRSKLCPKGSLNSNVANKGVLNKNASNKNNANMNDRKGKAGKLCPVSNKCGGCQFLDISYEEELKKKNQKMKSLLGEFGKVEDIIRAKDYIYYRNKVHAVLTRTREGKVLPGIYEEGTHRILPVNGCMIENKKAAEIIQSTAKLIQDFKIKVYNEDTEFGLVRHLLVRMAVNTGEIMLTIVTSNPIFPSKNNFVKALLKLHPEITTVVQNINEKRTSMVLGTREQVLYGKGYIVDTLMGKKFRISSQSFYQVNSRQTEVLYSKAIELLQLSGKELLLDAYCGTGTIGLICSDKAREVIGVELNKDAVKDAIMNAKANNVKNIRFYNNDAGKFLVEMKAQGTWPDALIMDPPRSGSDEVFINTLLQVKIPKIVYVSCGPESLARDLRLLKKAYRIDKICPVDMFSRCEHVEVTTLLQRVKG